MLCKFYANVKMSDVFVFILHYIPFEFNRPLDASLDSLLEVLDCAILVGPGANLAQAIPVPIVIDDILAVPAVHLSDVLTFALDFEHDVALAVRAAAVGHYYYCFHGYFLNSIELIQN